MFLRRNHPSDESLTARDLGSCLSLAQDCLKRVRQYFLHDNPDEIDAAIYAVEKALLDLRHKQ